MKEKKPDQEPNPSSELLEKFVKQLTDLTEERHKLHNEKNEELYKTVSDVQTTADEILQHFAHLKEEISGEVDKGLQGVVAETLDSAITATEEVKESLKVQEEEVPLSLLGGDWTEQMARWVSLYSRWKGKKEVTQDVMKNLANKVDSLIEKDLQFIEQYQNQSLAHLQEDPAHQKDLKEQLETDLHDSLRKLKELKKSPQTLAEASIWRERVHKKRSSYLDSVLQKIENVIQQEAPFANEPTDIASAMEIKAEYQFLEKEVDQVLAQLPRIDRTNEEQTAFLEGRLEELRGYIEELLESAKKMPEMKTKLNALLDRFPENLL